MSEWKPFTEHEIYHHSSTIHADAHSLKPSLRMYFSWNQAVVTTTFDSVIPLHLFQSIWFVSFWSVTLSNLQKSIKFSVQCDMYFHHFNTHPPYMFWFHRIIFRGVLLQ
jgi:hypothetical protein